MENHQAGNRKLVFLIPEGRDSKPKFTASEASMGPDSSSRTLLRHLFLFVSGSLIVAVLLACSSTHVNVLRLTSETFPSRPSASDVVILEQAPAAEHIRIAELSVTSTGNLEDLQQQILNRAAELGAQAVVFFPSVTEMERRFMYQPIYYYSPWGYYSPFYYGYSPDPYWLFGLGPGGYRQYVLVPYTVAVHTLKGIAIRYSGS